MKKRLLCCVDIRQNLQFPRLFLYFDQVEEGFGLLYSEVMIYGFVVISHKFCHLLKTLWLEVC